MQDMHKPQAIKFWKRLEESTGEESVISSLANKDRYPSRHTLRRYAQAHMCFKQGSPLAEVARKTGWSTNFVDKIRQWWEGEFTPPEQAQASTAAASTDSAPPQLSPVEDDREALRDCLQKWLHETEFVPLFEVVTSMFPPDPDTLETTVIDRVAEANGSSELYFKTFAHHVSEVFPPDEIEKHPSFATLKQSLRGTETLAVYEEEKKQFWRYRTSVALLFDAAEHFFVPGHLLKQETAELQLKLAEHGKIMALWLTCALLARGLSELAPDSFWASDCQNLGTFAARWHARILLTPGLAKLAPTPDAMWKDESDRNGTVAKTRRVIAELQRYRAASEKLSTALASIKRCPVSCPPCFPR